MNHFIDSATLRENVVSLARNIGYVPRSKKSAVATVSFNVDVSSISAQQVKLNAGLVALGSVQGGNYTFSIPEDITVTPTSNGIASFNNISIYEGNYLTKTFSCGQFTNKSKVYFTKCKYRYLFNSC